MNIGHVLIINTQHTFSRARRYHHIMHSGVLWLGRGMSLERPSLTSPGELGGPPVCSVMPSCIPVLVRIILNTGACLLVDFPYWTENVIRT